MIQCKKCGKWFEPYNFNLSGLCSVCQFTSTVSANTITITPPDKLLALGWKKTDDLRYEKILKQDNYQKIFMTIILLELAKILVEYLEELE